MHSEAKTQVIKSKFQKHLYVLGWKSYVQRFQRWRILAAECVFAFMLCMVAVYISKPVFLTPLQAEPIKPITYHDILDALPQDTILGTAPKREPYKMIMDRTAEILATEIISADDERKLNELLYNRVKGTAVKRVIWIIWKEEVDKIFKYSIRSTEVGRLMGSVQSLDGSNKDKVHYNIYLESGFLTVECAVNHAILEHTARILINYELSLVAMPVSPLMEEEKVHRAVSLILLCFTFALLPPVLETEGLVVCETENRFKRAMRIRGVDYTTIYLGWLIFAFFTALPVCMICSISLILIFRWIHLLYALVILLSYFTIMMVLAFIMSMFQRKALIASVWTTMQTLLQTFLAELIVHHKNLHDQSGILTFLFKALLPPLGLLNGFNEFALLRTGQEDMPTANSVGYTILSWSLLLFLYFMLLMLLQRTIGSARAIGGQVSWKSIIFKQVQDPNKLRPITKPSLMTKGKLQEVDELVAKAATFSNVSKNIMGVPLLKEVSFDIYRGEFTSIFAERIQDEIVYCIEDLLTGLTYADTGTITVLGAELNPGRNLLTERMMIGYCDRHSILIEDLTVEQHLYLYTEVCLWNQHGDAVFEFSVIRHDALKKECDLAEVYNMRVRDLSIYYRAQLCWAIAVLLEPRLVIMPDSNEHPLYKAVLRDKIMNSRGYLSIVSLTVSSMDLQYADRLFLLDHKVLAFGGTPAYMFYVYGNDYRVRLNFKSGDIDITTLEEFTSRLHGYGARIRAQMGSLLILRMPTTPTGNVAQLAQYIEENFDRLEMYSLSISLPDPEEVFRRAIHESREHTAVENKSSLIHTQSALLSVSKERDWKLQTTCCMNFTHLRIIAWKYFSCYIHYRFFLIVTVISALVAGVCIGWTLAGSLKKFNINEMDMKTLTVEAENKETILITRVDMSEQALAVARAYVLSHTNAPNEQVKKMSYISLVNPESVTEFLAERAVDSPKQYVNLYAYGMNVQKNGTQLMVGALYSPMHHDIAAAPRSIARVYMAMMRYFSGNLDASIEIEDSPLVLDFALLMDFSKPPLLTQFLLVLTISHITLVPSKEFGLIRHMQTHAMNFSPLRYWVNLAICDIVLYWILVLIISVVALAILLANILRSYVHLRYADLVAIPFMLMMYGVGCVPQAYLFSLGPSAPLNSMLLIITNIVFGEVTLVAKLLTGDAYSYALTIMALSPQFNMAYAMVKITQIFIYNCECIIFEKQHLCAQKVLHKCCEKCGVLQDCYKRKSYLEAIKNEVSCILGSASLMFLILLLWEYRYIPIVWNYIGNKLFRRKQDFMKFDSPGSRKEKNLAVEKNILLKAGKGSSMNYGENLLIVNASRMYKNRYIVRHIYLGLAKGEAVALAGLRSHGRVMLCDMISGYKTRNEGQIWAVSKYRQRCSPHRYARQVVLCSGRQPLSEWMTVYDGLEMLALMRGVPRRKTKAELENYLAALDLYKQADLQICHLLPNERYRLHFAAAVIGAPPILVFNDCTAYQTNTVKWAMYFIISMLRKRGHSIVHSGFSLESHLPVTNRLAIIRDGRLFDVDGMDVMQQRYGHSGYTVVVHLKDEVDINQMFQKHFYNFHINDSSDVLTNVQILDDGLSWAEIFQRMEDLREDNQHVVYSYIVCTKPIDYIYQNIIADETGLKAVPELVSLSWLRRIFGLEKKLREPPIKKLRELKSFVKKYSLTRLLELPWSVIFQR